MHPKQWRTKHKLNLSEMTAKLGMGSPGYLSDIERGEREPSGKIIQAYHRVTKGAVGPSDFQVVA